VAPAGILTAQDAASNQINARRRARRISDYPTNHPDEDLIEAIAEVGDDALLANGHGFQIITKDAEFTTQQAADRILDVGCSVQKSSLAA
jgi:hypothetical protein